MFIEEVPPALQADASLSPEAQLIEGEITERHRGAIQTALGRLPPELREVVELRGLQDMTYGQIGEKLRIARSTAQRRFKRASRLLRGTFRSELSE